MFNGLGHVIYLFSEKKSNAKWQIYYFCLGGMSGGRGGSESTHFELFCAIGAIIGIRFDSLRQGDLNLEDDLKCIILTGTSGICSGLSSFLLGFASTAAINWVSGVKGCLSISSGAICSSAEPQAVCDSIGLSIQKTGCCWAKNMIKYFIQFWNSTNLIP
jgi:hypothetical protein